MHKRDKTFAGRAVDALASLKLSIFLFFALASTSIFGTVIQQQPDPRAAIDAYGPVVGKVLTTLGLADMYHSWWFELLLGLLLVNTLVCSVRRLPRAVGAMGRDQFQDSEALGAKRFSASWDATSDAGERVTDALARSFGKPRVRQTGEGTSWFVQRQPWARLGPYVAHASLVLFFLGGIVGARYGFKGAVNIPEGQSVDAVQLRGGGTLNLGFEVTCESFELHTYPDGRPRDYLSRLVVRKGGAEVQRKTIEVNHPLIQDGIYFYQSSYGRVGGGALLTAVDRDGNTLMKAVRIPQDGAVTIPGSQLSVEVLGTTEDFDGFGPAVQLALVAQGPRGHAHVGEPFVVLQNFPEFDRRRGGDTIFQLSGLLPGRPYTGLQVAKDPGVPLIWAASALLTLGTLMAFFASHRRVWVHLEGGRLIVAGAAAKHQATFQENFAELTRALKEATETDAESLRRAAG